MARRGADYLASLKDDRAVYLDGARVTDIGSHPAFTPIASRIAELYDLAADPANGMLVDSPSGSAVNVTYTVPRSRDELTARRGAIEKWARHTNGWIGRSPDHVASFLAAFAAHPETFAGTDRDLGDNPVRYHRRVLDADLFVSYAIIPPQMSRATTAHAWEGDLVQVGVIDEATEGLVLRGAQMLATGGAVADEVFVSCIKPLGPEDRDFAVSVVLPVATPGLRLYCRRPYATAATSEFDYPLASRYDETDALVVFDDVLAPWERVFVDRDVDRVRRQFFDTGAHVLGNWQAQIRLSVKLQFICGLAMKIAQVNQVDKFPGVQERLGELASLAATTEACVLASEYQAAPDAAGMWRPASRPLYAAMGLQAEVYPRALSILRELAGGGVLQVPSSVADLTSDETRPDIDKYVRSPGVSAVERIKLFKLVWDATGSEFGGRHHQYEMFYAGAPFVAKGHAFRNYDFAQCVRVVDAFLEGYGAAVSDGRR